MHGGEIRILYPQSDFTVPVVECLSADVEVKASESIPAQEGQVSISGFKNLPPGKYRISYLSASDPLSIVHTLMETHVVVDVNSRDTVFLFRLFTFGKLRFPKDVGDFLDKHPRNFLTLTASYEGGKAPVVQARGGASAINYLRGDCEYHLKVWQHSYSEFPKDREVIYEKEFRGIPSETDPFGPE